jgi:hypothetical protein
VRPGAGRRQEPDGPTSRRRLRPDMQRGRLLRKRAMLGQHR